MDTPLNASAITAGALLSGNTFVVPPYQRDYAWESDEVQEFWDDLHSGLEEGTYFLGLVILTADTSRKHVVDGQQRILTITLLAARLYHEAVRAGRKALAERLKSEFLTSIDYETDETRPRVQLSDERDNSTLRALIESPNVPEENLDEGSPDLGENLLEASRLLQGRLQADLAPDPFKRLGLWSDFLTNQVYFAVFVHPDQASAYRVFEVINTRGRELTTADLLKNYIISQTAESERDARYFEWQEIARPLSPQAGPSSLVQFIRHVVTLSAGHVPPKDLFAYLANRGATREKRTPPSPPQLMSSLNERLPLYLQIIDPTLDGPAELPWLGVFSAFRDLGVITVRPLLIAISEQAHADEGMREVLKLVVRRIVVGTLGTGNVERRLSEAARRVSDLGSWDEPLRELEDLNPSSAEFEEKCSRRSFNKSTLAFLHRSIQQRTITPEDRGFLHLIRTRQASEWEDFPDDDFTYWGSTIGNSVVADVDRRPKGAASWEGFKDNLLPHLSHPGEGAKFAELTAWNAARVEERGRALAREATDLWFRSADG